MKIVDYTSPNAAEAFVASLHETGFGILENHPIQSELLLDIYKQWQLFFDSEDKFNYLFDEDKQDGYFPLSVSETAKGNALKDIKEFYHIYPSGRVPEYLQDLIQTYYSMTSTLAGEILGWIEQYSPSDVAMHYSEPLSSMIENTPNTLLRVLHYPPLTGDEPEGSIRAAAHEDINLITLLPASNQSGLQVKDKNGNWINLPCHFGNLIVNIGDMLQEASKGYFPSTTHQVVNPTGDAAKQSRISLPLFLHPRSEVVLSERYTQQSYLDERLKELGVKS